MPVKRNKEKKPKKPLTVKKKILIGIAAALGVLLLWTVGSVVYQVVVNGDYYAAHYTKRDLHITYRSAEPWEYEEDIFADQTYLSMNRDIRYISGSQSTEVALDEDAAVYGGDIAFFQRYFTCVINGAYSDYRAFFEDSYFSEDNAEICYPYPENAFTPQKLYNISVDYRRGESNEISDNESYDYYIVRYMILDNNGTFRPELNIGTTVPLLFELHTVGDTVRISKIVPYMDR